MAAGLVGYWPGETAIIANPVSRSYGRPVSHKQSIRLKPIRLFDDTPLRPRSSASETSPAPEIYYDALSTPAVVPQNVPCVPGTSNIIRSEPRLTDTYDIEWQKFQPPKELFDVPFGTPLEIESIIIASVERLHQQLAEEQSLHENTAIVKAQEPSRVKQEIPEVEVQAQTESSELLTVSNTRSILVFVSLIVIRHVSQDPIVVPRMLLRTFLRVMILDLAMEALQLHLLGIPDMSQD